MARKKYGGRTKGTPNKSTLEIKAICDAIFEQVDPVEYGVNVLKTNPIAGPHVFLKLLEHRFGKAIQPHSGTAADGSIPVSVTIRHVGAKA